MDYFFYIIIFFKMIADHRQISKISWSGHDQTGTLS